ncbi:hypothetical protein B0H14DRAFT_2621154 [Mycena olivaceomarginata]|nr:hypothetical protein B0H14DRAFT_2621154 [Mycena olivaceomarginata]
MAEMTKTSYIEINLVSNRSLRSKQEGWDWDSSNPILMAMSPILSSFVSGTRDYSRDHSGTSEEAEPAADAQPNDHMMDVSLYQNGTLMRGTNYDELDLLPTQYLYCECISYQNNCPLANPAIAPRFLQAPATRDRSRSLFVDLPPSATSSPVSHGTSALRTSNTSDWTSASSASGRRNTTRFLGLGKAKDKSVNMSRNGYARPSAGHLFNDNTLRTDDTNSGFGFKIGLPRSASVPGPAVLAPATTPAVRRRRRQSVDEDDIVEGSRQRKQFKRNNKVHKIYRSNPSPPPHPSRLVLLLSSAENVSAFRRRRRRAHEGAKKRVRRMLQDESRITHQNEAVPLPCAPESHPPYGSMPWRKHRGVSTAQGHGGEGTQAEMCGGWRGNLKVGTVMADHTKQMHANPTRCPNPTVEGKIMGFTIKNGTGRVPVPLL